MGLYKTCSKVSKCLNIELQKVKGTEGFFGFWSLSKLKKGRVCGFL